MYWNSSKLIKIFGFFFILLVTLSVDAKNNEISDTELERFKNELSEESKLVFNSLDRPNQERYYKKNTQLLEKLGYYSFLCACEEIKSNTEQIYPHVKGESKRNGRNKIIQNPHYEMFFDNVEEVYIPKNLLSIISSFNNLELTLDITNHRHLAINKLPNLFRHMYQFLTEFNSDKGTKHLREDSREHAQTILNNICKKDFNDDQKEQAIVDFATDYARIRHGSYLFSHHFRPQIQAKMSDKQKNLAKSHTNIRNSKTSEVEDTLPYIFDDLNFLKTWNFTISDLTVMNIVAEAVRQSKEKIYRAYHYDVLGSKGQRLLGVLPIVDLSICPSLPKPSTPFSSGFVYIQM